MGFWFKQPLVGEKRCVTTVITAAKETSDKLVQCSFWRFVDTPPIVRPRLRTHFADILKSQLVYTVQLKMIKGGLTLILFFSESMVSFADSPFKFLLLLPSPFLDL